MFSETVDIVVSRSGQAARKADIIAYCNERLRLLSVERRWHRSLIEDEITMTTNPFNWTYPLLLTHLKAVRYKEIDEWPTFRRPHVSQKRLANFYYAASDYFTFAGDFNVNSTLDVAYYTMSPYYRYVEPADRDAVYDQVAGTWSYAVTTSGIAADELAARQVAGDHWLLLLWSKVVINGALNDIFMDIQNDGAKQAFSRWNQGLKDLAQAESWEADP